MRSVGIRELKTNASGILREVREEGESFDVTYHGRVIARLVPVTESASESAPFDREAFMAGWKELAKEIGERWQDDMSAVDAVRDVRRDL